MTVRARDTIKYSSHLCITYLTDEKFVCTKYVSQLRRLVDFFFFLSSSLFFLFVNRGSQHTFKATKKKTLNSFLCRYYRIARRFPFCIAGNNRESAYTVDCINLFWINGITVFGWLIQYICIYFYFSAFFFSLFIHAPRTYTFVNISSLFANIRLNF